MSHEKPATRCDAVTDALGDLVDGAPVDDAVTEHLLSCDGCRDRLHEARLVAASVGQASVGYVPRADLEALVLAAIDARGVAKNEHEGIAPPPPPPPPPLADASSQALEVAPYEDAAPAAPIHSRGGKARGRLIVAVFGLAAAAAAVAFLRPRSDDTDEKTAKNASAAWHGSVTTIVRLGATGGGEGLALIDRDGQAHSVGQGDAIPTGAHLRTDSRTRAAITLDDGSTLTLDRATELVLDAHADRTARLVDGDLVAAIAADDHGKRQGDHGEKRSARPVATIALAGGAITTSMARVSLRSEGKSGASIAVARGKVAAYERADERRGDGTSVDAGEGASLRDGAFVYERNAGLSRAFSWADLDETTSREGEDAARVAGRGELRAHLPGAGEETDKPLRLSRQHVNVKIVGDVARTEIDETFASDQDQVLEGVFRFPLPAGAQIERLALEVDGQLQEGAFVDRDKGQAIWRGVMYQATPQHVLPKPQEQWVWVPGPWRDPALLEWKQGGRMELRIYPIPAHGVRRVVIAYTERVAASAGVRRYVYPLPEGRAGASAVADFALDVQVRGYDTARGVRIGGYDGVTIADDTGVAHRTIAASGFVPAGDLVVEYARKDEGSTLTTVGYVPPSGLGAVGEEPFVALTITPTLPRVATRTAHSVVFVVDTSRSMVGERYARASALVGRAIEELDPRDRFAVLGCDIACVPLTAPSSDGGNGVEPSREAAARVRTSLAAITPDGASDLEGALTTAASLTRSMDHGSTSDRAARIVYVGDGAPTIGARSSAGLEAAAHRALSSIGTLGGVTATISSVAVGVDADRSSLDAIARGGEGSVVPYVPGETLASAALSIVETTYASALADATIDLPAGLVQIAPAHLGAMRAGEERLIVARATSAFVSGNATLRGTIAGTPWSMTVPLEVRATGDAGNAFVPRLFAQATIADLESSATVSDVDRARIVSLSQTFAVPSRYTSLLVLESEAMASAFDVHARAPAVDWSGEGDDVHTAASDIDGAAVAQGKSAVARSRALRGATDFGFGGVGSIDDMAGAGGGGRAMSPPSPAKKSDLTDNRAMPSMPSMPSSPSMPSMHAATGASPEPMATIVPPSATTKTPTVPMPQVRPSGHWELRHQEWFRQVHFVDLSSGSSSMEPGDLATKIVSAKSALAAAPEARDRIETLYGLLSRRDSVDDARSLLSTWSAHDPLDSTALLHRAELTARDGDRHAALRIETGALELRPDDVDLADALVRSATLAGDAHLACALRAVHAEVRPKDATEVAARATCASDSFGAYAVVPIATRVGGDLVLDATWTSGADLDLAVIDPKGARFAWISPRGVASVVDPTSASHESLAMPWLSGGSYLIEVVRASSNGGSAIPANGTVNARILGDSHAFPLALAGSHATVGRIDITWSSRWVAD